MYMKIAFINGPNLNLVGKREIDVYGSQPLDTYLQEMALRYPSVSFSFFQSNVEGAIIDEIQRVGFSVEGIVINPGGYSHTSIAIADAIAAVPCKAVEVHISNIYAREEYRKHSYVSAKAVGVISGLGLTGYDLAVRYLIESS